MAPFGAYRCVSCSGKICPLSSTHQNHWSLEEKPTANVNDFLTRKLYWLLQTSSAWGRFLSITQGESVAVAVLLVQCTCVCSCLLSKAVGFSVLLRRHLTNENCMKDGAECLNRAWPVSPQQFHSHLGWYWETFTRWLILLTVNVSSLSETQLLLWFSFQASVIAFKMQGFSYADTQPRCLRVVLSVLHQSALLLLVFWHFLAWRECYLLAVSRENADRLFSGRKTYRSMTLLLIESQVLPQGMMLRQILF